MDVSADKRTVTIVEAGRGMLLAFLRWEKHQKNVNSKENLLLPAGLRYLSAPTLDVTVLPKNDGLRILQQEMSKIL